MSLTADVDGKAVYTNVPSGSSLFTRYVMTNNGLAAGTFGTNLTGESNGHQRNPAAVSVP